jgi:hypothetical protein
MVNLNKVYLDVNDIMELLSYKDVKSYKIIKVYCGGIRYE